MNNHLKDDGGQYGIIWKKITFLDFVWNLESEAGVQICKGNLYFLSHGNSYSVSVECVLVKEKYTLTRVNYLTEYARVEDNVKTE